MRLSRNRNWGHPESHRSSSNASPSKAPKVGWRGTAGRRHGAAARRPDADRPLEPSGRARRRHLVHADAGPRADAQGARGDVGDQRRRRQLEGRESEDLVAGTHRAAARPPRRTRRSSACWSIRRSRRRCAATSRATAPGCTRCARCTATTITSTSASAARPDRTDCKPQPPAPAEEGCGADLDWWFKKMLNPSRRRPGRAAAQDVGAAGGLQAGAAGGLNALKSSRSSDRLNSAARTAPADQQPTPASRDRAEHA